MQVTVEPDDNSFSINAILTAIRKICQKINIIFLIMASIFILLLTLIISPFLVFFNILTELNINLLINTGDIDKALKNIEKEKDPENRILLLNKIVAYYKRQGNNDLVNKYIKKVEGLKFQLTYD